MTHPNLNFDQIRAFLAVVRLGGVGRAAQHLNLTQPAVTARLQKLETALGKALFDRSGGVLRPTRAGELFRTYAERFEQLGNLVQTNVIDDAAIRGALRIGASETVTQCWLPDFVSRLHRRFPSLQIEIDVDISVSLRDALLDRRIDLAFLLGPLSEHRVDNLALPSFELGWYRSPRLERDAAGPEEGDAGFLRYPVISYLRPTRPFRQVRDMLLDRLGPGVRLFPSSSLSASFRLIEAGIGVGALPVALARPFEARGAICRFDPGWVPPPLEFTASYIAEPRSHTVEIAANLAREAAVEHRAITNSYGFT
ncbi:LysR family transcriptional regulator [Palleronia sediminis]|uniref:LysR family transcriptional regulator n=1 Tax=Palleronia sediminis TaxID=2547833 RepID=A0A4R6ABF4_9RHOB|nr:LysR family transcriptional regulator [Palleronia sediminis]TDL79648.1 LysR family transcriptional regulator [Palleronia sediminis]